MPRVAKLERHDETTPSGWRAAHRDHGRCGPFVDAKIGEWNAWRCPCGSTFKFTDAQRDRDPALYSLGAVR